MCIRDRDIGIVFMDAMSIFPVKIMPDDDLRPEPAQLLDLKRDGFLLIIERAGLLDRVGVPVDKLRDDRIGPDPHRPQPVQQLVRAVGLGPVVGKVDDLHLDVYKRQAPHWSP